MATRTKPRKRRTTATSPALRRVEAAAKRVEAARLKMEATVIGAYRAGYSLREIGAATDLAPESVRKIVREAGISTAREVRR